MLTTDLDLYENDMDTSYDPRKLEEFKKAYRERETYDLEAQVPYLSDLAQHYEKRFKSTRHWVDVIKAHTLYNSCAVRSSPVVWQKRAFRLQQDYWGESVQVSFQVHQKQMETFTRKLKNLRTRVNVSLGSLNNLFQEKSSIDNLSEADSLSEVLCEKTPNIMSGSTQQMIQFIGSIISYAVELQNVNATCRSIMGKFSVVGLGSIARQEATPYSEFDFIFLTADENDCHRMLLEKLALTCHFLINNVGETNLNTIHVEELGDWFHDEAVCGIRLGGLVGSALRSIPEDTYFGNGHCYISTVQELVTNFKNNYDNPIYEDDIQTDFSSILSSTVQLYGNDSLLSRFQEQISLIPPNLKRGITTMRTMISDIEIYDLSFNESPEQLKIVRQDVLTFPSLLLFSLQWYYHIHGVKSTEILINLEKTTSLSKQFVKGVRTLYFSSQYVRQSCYSYCRSQSEQFSLHFAHPIQSNASRMWSIPRSLLYLMLMYLIPIKIQVKTCPIDQPTLLKLPRPILLEQLGCVMFTCRDYSGFLRLEGDFATDTFDNIHMRIQAHLECNNYASAARLLEKLQENQYASLHNLIQQYSLWSLYYEKKGNYHKSLQFKHFSFTLQVLHLGNEYPEGAGEDYNELGCWHCNLGEYDASLSYYMKALSIESASNENAKNSFIAIIHSNIGLVYGFQSKYQCALESYEKALSIFSCIYGDVHHPHTAKSHNNIGQMHHRLGEYEKAVESYSKALSIVINIHDGNDHPNAAEVYYNLGMLYLELAEYEKALKNLTNALSIFENSYDDAEHPSIANTYRGISRVLLWRAEYDKALKCCKRALNIEKKCYGGENHPNISISYNDIANVYSCQGEYQNALESYKKSLSITLVTSSQKNLEAADLYNNIATEYFHLNEHSKAFEYCNKALSIARDIFGDDVHPTIARSILLMGDLKYARLKFIEAIELYNKAFSIQMNIYGGMNHPEIALSYSKIGVVYFRKLNLSKAAAFFNKALLIYKTVYGHIHHPDVAITYQLIGTVHSVRREYMKAMEYYNKALSILTKVFEGKIHHDMATIHKCIANVHLHQHDYVRALENLSQALDIEIEVYGDINHVEIAVTHENIAIACFKQEQYVKALEHFEKALSIFRAVHGDKVNPEERFLKTIMRRCIHAIYFE